METYKLPKAMSDIINVGEEQGDIKKALQEVSDSNNAVLLTFIAPYGSVKVSPVEERVATISLVEEWSVEYALSCISGELDNTENLYLLINSPGGAVPSCYSIAYMLRNCFKNIKAFIPQVALSGGSLIALSSNELVMGPASRLSPFDVQVPYKGEHVSAYAMGKALSRLTQYFKTVRAEEAPYPWCAMADKLDAIILEEWSTSLSEMAGYATEIVRSAGYKEEQVKRIVRALVLTENTHSFVIHKERAKEMGLNVSEREEDVAVLNLMREWLTQYAFESKATHCIRYVLPKSLKRKKGGLKGGQKNESVTSQQKGRRAKKGSTNEKA